eukprot:COSAG05_NODE_3509_length_2019_cov_1.798437_2_plen_146_part_00
MCKVADFGLSRDKEVDVSNTMAATVMMTGCGSVIWMAPEIITGKTYNEKIDVFSYGMCVLELVDCHLPWHGCASPAEVPYKVTKSTTRPRPQLKRAENMGWLWVRALIEKCWSHEPGHRPSFTEIVSELEDTQATIAANLIGGLE